MLDYEIQQQINSVDRGSVKLPNGRHILYQDVFVHDDIEVRGESQAGCIVELRGTARKGFVYRRSGSNVRSHTRVAHMTFETLSEDCTGIYSERSGQDQYDHLTFKGVARTIHLVDGYGHTISDVGVETHGLRRAGSLILESQGFGITDYCQVVNVARYRVHGAPLGTFSVAVILRRVTNAQIDVQIMSPGQPAVLLEGDCQGIKFVTLDTVACTQGVIMQPDMFGVAPQNIDFIAPQIDQHSASAWVLNGGYDIRVLGGETSNGSGGNGVEIGPWPIAQRIAFDRHDVLGQVNNGIVGLSGARWYTVDGCRFSAVRGACVIQSPGQSNYLEVCRNDFSQQNGLGALDLSTLPPGQYNRKRFTGNIEA